MYLCAEQKIEYLPLVLADSAIRILGVSLEHLLSVLDLADYGLELHTHLRSLHLRANLCGRGRGLQVRWPLAVLAA